MSVKLIVDSGSDLSLEQAQALDVILVPMTVRFGEKEYHAGVDMSNEAFYDMLASNTDLPTTSQPTPFDFEQVYQEVTKAGDEAVVICISSALSGTVQSARIAAADYDGIYVVDSLNVTISQRLLIDYAQRLIQDGLCAKDVAEKLEEAKKRVVIYAAVDTLDYLIKGGRLSKTAGVAGKLLGIRPILHIQDGALVVVGKARGPKGAITMLNDIITKCGGVDFSMPHMVGYSGTDRSNLDAYLAASKEVWGEDLATVPVGEIGSTIGTHTGPGLIAMAFFPKN